MRTNGQTIGLSRIHLPGPNQWVSSCVEVTSFRTSITASGIEHRLVYNDLRRSWLAISHLPLPQPVARAANGLIFSS
ncbi:hypothetical protein [Prochlorococcus marinus]|uniref:hypothetical protein n=1 Tax=Prochlorococcus marinus TaxID=1219 RepID=UPI0007B3DE7F|nr:hypothetical protein [Prochlorococcus marinus]